MLALGGSLLEPAERRSASLSVEVLTLLQDHQIARALVVGGATQDTLDVFATAGAIVTVLDIPEWCSSDLYRAPGVDTIECSSWEQLHDLPAGWYDAVLLLGGTLETGGPWLKESDDWGAIRNDALSLLESIASGTGLLIADRVGPPRQGRQYLVGREQSSGETTMSFATIVTRGADIPVLVLRTARFDHTGVFMTEILSSREVSEYLPGELGQRNRWRICPDSTIVPVDSDV